MLPNETGMLPVKALWSSSMSSRLSELPKVLGIGPDRLFDESCKYVRCLALPMLGWSAPCRLFTSYLTITN
jgi:hypothetical protein